MEKIFLTTGEFDGPLMERLMKKIGKTIILKFS